LLMLRDQLRVFVSRISPPLACQASNAILFLKKSVILRAYLDRPRGRPSPFKPLSIQLEKTEMATRENLAKLY